VPRLVRHLFSNSRTAALDGREGNSTMTTSNPKDPRNHWRVRKSGRGHSSRKTVDASPLAARSGLLKSGQPLRCKAGGTHFRRTPQRRHRRTPARKIMNKKQDPEAVETAQTTNAPAVVRHLFENVSCSQCGRDFGPGNHGYSHCSDHTGRQCAGCKWAQEKEDRYDQLRCCCDDSPNAWGDVEATDCCESFLPNSVDMSPSIHNINQKIEL